MTDPIATSEDSTWTDPPLRETAPSSAEAFGQGWRAGHEAGYEWATKEQAEPWHGKVMLSEGKMDE